MTATPSQRPRRVLLVSSHRLFSEGLRSFLRRRHAARIDIVGVAASLDAAAEALEQLKPDLVIVDHDDQVIRREEFLARFVAGKHPMQVVLVSLKETGPVVVYDRRSLTMDQVEDWLDMITSAAADEPERPLDRVRRVDMKHFAIVAVLVAIVTVVVSVALDAIGLLPAQASAQAVVIDRLFDLHIKVIAFLFALIVVFMGYSIVVFRRKPGETGDGDHFEGHTGLEITWTLLPLGVVLLFSALGAQALADTRRPEPNAFEVNVISSQWSWAFEYPEHGVTSTSLYLPVDRQVVLKLTSTDVIHSFWVPEFRVKQDALPGADLVKELRITPTQIGEYKVRCAELCGRLHAYMESPVVVLAQADFDAWLAEQSAISNDPVERGKKWAAQFGCVACHSLDGSTIVGPTWQGLYGAPATLADGTAGTADDAYLRQSIVDPNAVIAQGFSANIMPANFGERLTDAQIADMIEYIKTLK